MMTTKRLILGSGSPRRRELLSEAGYDFEVIAPAPEAELEARSNLGPADLVGELARCKAADVASQLEGATGSKETVIIAADTVAECDGVILGKPSDQADAEQMLRQMSGKLHRVYTGLCLWPVAISTPTNQCAIEVDVTTLKMDSLADGQLKEYLKSNQWQGKAGAFGYQDGLDWVHIIEGSESNVVGLPMELLTDMLENIS